MLTNAPLRLKLSLILLFPLLGFLVLAGLYLSDNYRTLRDMDSTVEASRTALSLSELITMLQRERGASGVYIGSHGASMGNRLAQMRNDSNAAIDAVRRVPVANNADITPLLETLNTLANLRGQVDKLAIDSIDSGSRYTEIIKALHRLYPLTGEPC